MEKQGIIKIMIDGAGKAKYAVSGNINIMELIYIMRVIESQLLRGSNKTNDVLNTFGARNPMDDLK